VQPQAHSYGVAVIGPGLEPQTPSGASARQHAIILEDDQVTSSHSNSPLSPEGPKHPSRLINRTLMVFLVAMISANIASQMGQPLMSLYVQSLGANVQQVGLLFTITSIVPLAFQILGGFVSDSIGRLQAIAIGSLAGIAGYALYIVAPTWQWLILAQGVSSLAGCFVAPSFRAFVAEQSSEEMRARTFALSESIYMITGVVGPPIGGIVSENYGYRAMFATAAALYGAATVIRIAMARSARNRVLIR
jgi:MFS family permease